MLSQFKIVLFGFILFGSFGSIAETTLRDQHIQVSMRLIGHEVLLASGDTVSRVMPIEKIEDRYKISFDTQFSFVPDDLVIIIDDVVSKTELASNYIVEVENCLTQQVVYSYEIDVSDTSSFLPCRQRAQPTACYNIYVTIISAPNFGENKLMPEDIEKEGDSLVSVIIFIILIGGIILFFLLRKKPEAEKGKSHLINIGDYKFDQIQMELFYAADKVELTSKESDLLILLHKSANKVVERDVILQAVWGDEGDYVGRTLDVFISKLRKKLTKDDSVKIVNVRGVGYKLIIGE